jgi:hypothetical protein
MDEIATTAKTLADQLAAVLNAKHELRVQVMLREARQHAVTCYKLTAEVAKG